jgi:sulfate adenylyltransferase
MRGLRSYTDCRPPFAVRLYSVQADRSLSANGHDATRKEVRSMIAPLGGFLMVHLSTPIEACERRDRKGSTRKARAGILKDFTGVSDPYEVPTDAEVVINTAELTPEEAAQEIILHLEREGFIGVSR